MLAILIIAWWWFKGGGKPFANLTFRPYGHLPFGNMTIWQYDHLTVWPFDNMTIWQYDHLKKWPFANLTIRPFAWLNFSDQHIPFPLTTSSLLQIEVAFFLYPPRVHLCIRRSKILRTANYCYYVMTGGGRHPPPPPPPPAGLCYQVEWPELPEFTARVGGGEGSSVALARPAGKPTKKASKNMGGLVGDRDRVSWKRDRKEWDRWTVKSYSGTDWQKDKRDSKEGDRWTVKHETYGQ